MNKNGSTAIWGLIIAAVVVTAIFGWTRLSGLPELEILLGPDLTVRQVAVEREMGADGQKFQPGDRLTHLDGFSLTDLQELRVLLPPLLEDVESPEFDEESQEADELEAIEDEHVSVLNYQLFRPIHRFTVELDEEMADPTELPSRIEEGDRLVAVDGGFLPGPVGTEGIRSIVENRSDSVLSIERSNATFSGQLQVEKSGHYPGVLLGFLIVLLVVFGLWRWHSESVGARSAYFVALETLAVGLLMLLIFGFQWVLGDVVLAGGVIVALTMIRPLSMMARSEAQSDGDDGVLIGLGVGAVSAVVLIGLMAGGWMSSAEEALHAAAIVAGLFIVYELSAGSVEERSLLDLGDRGIFLAGIVMLGLLAGGVALVMDPVAFREDSWRWFAVLLPLVLWFGDVLYAVHYGAASAMGEAADRKSRRQVIGRYLQEIAVEMPHTDLRLIGSVDGQALEMKRGPDGLMIEAADASLSDAVDILVTENARVPLPEGTDRGSHPMAGIATSMNMSLALVLYRPTGSLSLEGLDVHLALIGMRQSSDGDVPSYASSETLDRAQELWRGPVASAAMIEVVVALWTHGVVEDSSGEPSSALQRKLDDVHQELEQCREQRQQLEETRHDLESSLTTTRRSVRIQQLGRRPSVPPMQQGQWSDLLEEQLIEGLEFLLDEPEPIAFAGPIGGGKGFTAYCAHCIDGGDDADFVVIDTADADAADRLDEIIGEEGGGEGPGLLDQFQGALLVRGTQRCDDGQILALCHQCEEHDIRLYLAFDDGDAETRSVLEGRPETIQELLGHREVIIPHFRHRPSIQMAVFEFWLGYWTESYGRSAEGFSRMAVEALEAYGYPGELREAVEVVRWSVLDADHDVIDRENLPLQVRDARPL